MAASLGRLGHEKYANYYPPAAAASCFPPDHLAAPNNCAASTNFFAAMADDANYFPELGGAGYYSPPWQAVLAAENERMDMSYEGRWTSRSAAAAGNGGGRASSSRIGFRTRSEVEVLDDGFKWRKYGKKAVKSSPNPRNYYRCSAEGCGVKKRVERDRHDPRYVLTTYDGIHNHAAAPAAGYHAPPPPQDVWGMQQLPAAAAATVAGHSSESSY